MSQLKVEDKCFLQQNVNIPECMFEIVHSLPVEAQEHSSL